MVNWHLDQFSITVSESRIFSCFALLFMVSFHCIFHKKNERRIVHSHRRYIQTITFQLTICKFVAYLAGLNKWRILKIMKTYPSSTCLKGKSNRYLCHCKSDFFVDIIPCVHNYNEVSVCSFLIFFISIWKLWVLFTFSLIVI